MKTFGKTFLAVLKNDYARTVPRLAGVVILTAVTLASIFLAVYVTGIQQVKGHIAIIAGDPGEKQAISGAVSQSSEHLEITVLDKEPPRSDLVKQKYDAIVFPDGEGNYRIETLRSAQFKTMLETLLKNPQAQVESRATDRGTGMNIIGFMMMFLLMGTFANLFPFADDKEQGQLQRIAAAPVSFAGYLAGHCLYCFSLLLPLWAMLAVLSGLGWDIGFSLPQYGGLILVLGWLGMSFALLLHTLIDKPDNAAMLGNALTVLTSILSGSFYASSRNNGAIDHLVKLIPQKELMDFVQALQNGNGGQEAASLIYVLGFSCLLFIVAWTVLRRRYVKTL